MGLASCVTAPPVEHHVDPAPPPIIELTLDVRGNRIGLVGAYGGPMCEGPISGVVTVRDPAGREQRIEVKEVQTYEEVCQGCDPVPGHPESCDDACEHRPMELIELGHGPFLGPGRYHVSGDELVLACAPDHTRFVAIDVDVDPRGFTRVAEPGSPPPPVVSVQPVPKEAIRASQGAGIFASSWTTRDAGGGDALAIDVGVALDDAKVRWDALIERSGAEVEAALSEAAAQSEGDPYGKEQTTVEQRFAPTWLPEETQLRVRWTADGRTSR